MRLWYIKGYHAVLVVVPFWLNLQKGMVIFICIHPCWQTALLRGAVRWWNNHSIKLSQRRLFFCYPKANRQNCNCHWMQSSNTQLSIALSKYARKLWGSPLWPQFIAKNSFDALLFALSFEICFFVSKKYGCQQSYLSQSITQGQATNFK